MDRAYPSEPARRDVLIRRQLAELTERQGWVHHVVDGATGEVLTTPLDRPLAPLSRAERLARLGHPIPQPGPWGPVYKLTARSPYQAAPLNWLTAFNTGVDSVSLPDGEDLIVWGLPKDFQQPMPGHGLTGLRVHFDEPPQQRCVLTLKFAAGSHDGAVGHITFQGW